MGLDKFKVLHWRSLAAQVCHKSVTKGSQKFNQKRLTPANYTWYNWRTQVLDFKGFFLGNFWAKKIPQNAGFSF
jgi:hypothetical protein